MDKNDNRGIIRHASCTTACRNWNNIGMAAV